jgi:hypothetical protein
MGLFGNFFKKDPGQDAGNLFQALNTPAQEAARAYMTRDAQAGSRELLADPVYGKLYSEGGDFDQLRGDIGSARGEERRLQQRGFSRQPEDYEAYGQASGDIARESGLQEASLAQALANRGIGGSAAGGQSFMTHLGSKTERLAGMQRKIADDRMKTNLARLSETRQHMNNLMGQRGNMLGQYEQGRAAKDRFAESKGTMGMNTLSASQAQENERMAQRQATKQNSGFNKLMQVGMTAGGAALGGPGGAAAGSAAGGAIFGG